MSDGYWAYREIDQRLRCLPHIIRKARALEEGFEAEGRALGRHVLDVIAAVMQVVYEARGAPAQGELRERVRGSKTSILQGESPCSTNCPFRWIGWGRVVAAMQRLNLPRQCAEKARRRTEPR